MLHPYLGIHNFFIPTPTITTLFWLLNLVRAEKVWRSVMLCIFEGWHDGALLSNI